MAERRIAEEICNASKNTIINLSERDLSLGGLKALFSAAELVVSNDTGPRHIAIALERKLVTLFGPNDPVWTDSGYENEIQIIGDVPCAPCSKPECEQDEHLCMEAITVEMVCEAAKKLLEAGRKVEGKQKFKEISKSLFVDTDFEEKFKELGLTTIEAVFSFDAGKDLIKDNLGKHRSRTQFEMDAVTVFLKRYCQPPILTQIRNWLARGWRISFGLAESELTKELSEAGMNTPKVVAYGEQWGRLFEKRSFVITEKIPNAESLERRLPEYFDGAVAPEKIKLRRRFIEQLAGVIGKFHEAGYRHRDLYFSHIFYSTSGEFYLIDLARVFRPKLLAERFRVKDVAQIHYSAPKRYFSRTDRLRFYLWLASKRKLDEKDRLFIHKVLRKAGRMERHDARHGRSAPFQN
jgi:hypothetical protein